MKKFIDSNKSEAMHLGFFVIVFVGIGLVVPEQFFTKNSISTMAFQLPELGLLAIGMMAAVLTGGINLSIVTTATLSSILGAYILSGTIGKDNPILAILLTVVIAVAVSVLAGIINGYFIAYAGVAALLVTLGTTTLFEGIGLNITKGGAISGFPKEFMAIGNGSVLGIPIPMIIFIVAAVVSYFLLERTAWGVRVHMLGSNPIATEFSGISIKATTFKVYIFSGVMSALAGLIMISRYNSAKVDYGSSYVMQAVTAVVLGGTSITGGHGTVVGTVIAVMIIQIVSTGLNIIGVNRNIIDITIGAILLGVLAVRHFSQVFSDRALIKKRKTA